MNRTRNIKPLQMIILDKLTHLCIRRIQILVSEIYCAAYSPNTSSSGWDRDAAVLTIITRCKKLDIYNAWRGGGERWTTVPSRTAHLVPHLLQPGGAVFSSYPEWRLGGWGCGRPLQAGATSPPFPFILRAAAAAGVRYVHPPAPLFPLCLTPMCVEGRGRHTMASRTSRTRPSSSTQFFHGIEETTPEYTFYEPTRSSRIPWVTDVFVGYVLRSTLPPLSALTSTPSVRRLPYSFNHCISPLSTTRYFHSLPASFGMGAHHQLSFPALCRMSNINGVSQDVSLFILLIWNIGRLLSSSSSRYFECTPYSRNINYLGESH